MPDELLRLMTSWFTVQVYASFFVCGRIMDIILSPSKLLIQILFTQIPNGLHMKIFSFQNIDYFLQTLLPLKNHPEHLSISGHR